MREISVKFVDFWPDFNADQNNFVDALRRKGRRVNVIPEESPETPDILFYSRCGSLQHYKYDCLKIYYTGENDFPDFNECDYAISFYDYDCGGRNLRYPLYMFYDELNYKVPLLTATDALARRFCSVVVSNVNNCDPRRIEIIDRVESYKHVDFGGRFRNNVGGPISEKLPFISKYKFNLALENSYVRGYVTEKILEPFVAGTVPIYWGDDLVKCDFNPESFINVNDYSNCDTFIADLKRIDNSDTDYLKLLNAPKRISETASEMNRRLEEFLNNIADSLERRVPCYGEVANRWRRNSRLLPFSNNKLLFKGAKIVNKFFK